MLADGPELVTHVLVVQTRAPPLGFAVAISTVPKGPIQKPPCCGPCHLGGNVAVVSGVVVVVLPVLGVIISLVLVIVTIITEAGVVFVTIHAIVVRNQINLPRMLVVGDLLHGFCSAAVTSLARYFRWGSVLGGRSMNAVLVAGGLPGVGGTDLTRLLLAFVAFSDVRRANQHLSVIPFTVYGVCLARAC
jgi:hypothetical protein